MRRRTKVKNFARGMPFIFDGASLLSVVLILISMALMGISAVKPHSFDFARTRTADFFAPFLSFVSLPFQQMTILLHDVTGLAQLQADNSRLEQENSNLRDWYQTALLLDSENKSLKKLLNLKVDSKYEHLAARVIADVGNTYVKSLLVTVGQVDGVEKGAAVLSGDGLVGRIVEVGEDSSRILLVTDINSRIPVVIEDTGQHAIMAGLNLKNPRLMHMPQDSGISNNARVITSGYGGVYPHGLPVGRVVIGDDGKTDIELFANFDAIQIVRVLKKVEAIENAQ